MKCQLNLLRLAKKPTFHGLTPRHLTDVDDKDILASNITFTTDNGWPKALLHSRKSRRGNMSKPYQIRGLLRPTVCVRRQVLFVCGRPKGRMIPITKISMAKTRSQKEDIVARLTDRLSKATSVVFAEQSALSVTDMDTLRHQARKEHVSVMLSKKSLTTIAAKNAGLKDIDVNSLPNSIMTIIGHDDEIAPARLVAQFAKTHNTVKIVGGMFEGAFASQAQMVALSLLPSKEELYAKLVGSLNAPISGFVNVMAGNLRGLVTALKRIQEQKV